MNRALALLPAVVVAGTALAFSTTAVAAGPSVIASIYAPTIEIGANDASPDGLMLEIRQPLNRNFWLGAALTTAFGDDQITPGTNVEIGNSLTFNLGVQSEFQHHVTGYAYLGYGQAEVDITGGGIDGKGVAWGLGVNFQLNDVMLVDVGYASLFDDDMEDSTGTAFDTSIAGPHVGIGAKF